MKKGIAVAGTMLVDTIYPIDHYPENGGLAAVWDNITRATGGAVCNVIMDLAKLDEALPLTALGAIGNDENGSFIEENLSAFRNIDLSQVARGGTTSFSAVMSDMSSNQRTFFSLKGASVGFSEAHIDWDRLNVRHLHAGYLLFLDELDGPDEEFGTKMARLLASAQSRGISTSIDLVSGSFDRCKAIVPPALKYTDYCIINETEAEGVTGVSLRKNGRVDEENIFPALRALKDMGVSRWAVIHAPEGGYGLDCSGGEFVKKKSMSLPDGFIRGTTGAGDAFCSGVLYAAYLGKSLTEAIELGIGCAACSLSEPGATEGMCSYEKVLEFYNKMK
ncbi:MAG: carbohydrate kinase family protein [Oscillospiraceae bacterium]